MKNINNLKQVKVTENKYKLIHRQLYITHVAIE